MKSKKRNSSKKVSNDLINKLIPKYKIVNSPAFASVIFDLKKDQSILVNSGMMMYMDSHLNVDTNTQGGILKGFVRDLFTDTSMFMTKYTGTQIKNEISCASFLPGDLLPLIIEPGKKYMISHHSLVCYTENLKLETKSKFKGFLVNEGIFQLEIENNSLYNGCVWLAAYGGYNLKTIEDNESFKLENGLFLAAESDVDYSITKVGSTWGKTAILSGQGLLMGFKNPCKVYYSGRNLHALENYLKNMTRSK